MRHVRRSAWGFSGADDEADWRMSAACASQPDLWWADAPAVQRWARHICVMHCPVLAQCLAWARRSRPAGGIEGGLLWASAGNNRGVPRRDQPFAMLCDDACYGQPYTASELTKVSSKSA